MVRLAVLLLFKSKFTVTLTRYNSQQQQPVSWARSRLYGQLWVLVFNKAKDRDQGQSQEQGLCSQGQGQGLTSLHVCSYISLSSVQTEIRHFLLWGRHIEFPTYCLVVHYSRWSHSNCLIGSAFDFWFFVISFSMFYCFAIASAIHLLFGELLRLAELLKLFLLVFPMCQRFILRKLIKYKLLKIRLFAQTFLVNDYCPHLCWPFTAGHPTGAHTGRDVLISLSC